MIKYIWLLGIATLLYACDPARVYEKNEDLENQQWIKNQKVFFEFVIPDASQAYNIYANLRNAQHYPFHNLYYQYELMDSAGRIVVKQLNNILLFEPKTGKPFGTGLGDVFDHRQMLLENYHFPAEGTYQMNMEQYMRTDSLPLILSVGVRVELVQ